MSSMRFFAGAIFPLLDRADESYARTRFREHAIDNPAPPVRSGRRSKMVDPDLPHLIFTPL